MKKKQNVAAGQSHLALGIGELGKAYLKPTAFITHHRTLPIHLGGRTVVQPLPKDVRLAAQQMWHALKTLHIIMWPT